MSTLTVADPIPPERLSAPQLTVVVPCFNEQEVLPALFDRIEDLDAMLQTTGRIAGPLRLLLVDDGSSDLTWATIKSATRSYKVIGVKLSRNYGHQKALMAGLAKADTEVVISMDADLQDDPNAAADMLDAYRAGAEIVFGVRASRSSDTAFKRTSARTYYRLLSWLGVDLIADHADYRLMSRKALRALSQYGESNLYLRGLVHDLGFKTDVVFYDRERRVAGKSKYNLGRMLGLAIDGVTSFSVKPLRLITLAGFAVATLSFMIMVYYFLAWANGNTVSGWASVVLPIYFLGGAHLIALGVIGEYIGKIYNETKRRPRFIIDETAANEARAAPNSVGVAKFVVR